MQSSIPSSAPLVATSSAQIRSGGMGSRAESSSTNAKQNRNMNVMFAAGIGVTAAATALYQFYTRSSWMQHVRNASHLSVFLQWRNWLAQYYYGSMLPFATKSLIVDDAYVVKIATSLAKKPDAPTVVKQTWTQSQDNEKDTIKPQAQFNPFLPPFEPGLGVLLECPELPYHRVLFNKFPVQWGHLLVVTRTFEPQDSPITKEDLIAIDFTLANKNLFNGEGIWFFNCGPQSGFSQQHKHFQLLPRKSFNSPAPLFDEWIPAKLNEDKSKIVSLEVDKEGNITNATQWSSSQPQTQQNKNINARVLVSVAGENGCPFPFYMIKNWDKMSSPSQHGYEHRAKQAMLSDHRATQIQTVIGSLKLDSYNLIFNRDFFLIIPREHDFQMMNGIKIGLNAMSFTGHLFVKNDEAGQVLSTKNAIDRLLCYVTSGVDGP